MTTIAQVLAAMQATHDATEWTTYDPPVILQDERTADDFPAVALHTDRQGNVWAKRGNRDAARRWDYQPDFDPNELQILMVWPHTFNEVPS